MYNFNHLYYFYTTVKSGGVTEAAKHLYISQPSLSIQIKVLEDYLQLKLFKKAGRRNELTTEGNFIFGYCREMFEVSEIMQESIAERLPNTSRKINIGVSNEIANSFVVEVISSFLKKYNNNSRPKVTMVSGTDQKITEQLKFREIDVSVTSSAMTSSELENLQRIEVPVNLICSLEAKRLVAKKHSPIKEIFKALGEDGTQQWVMPISSFKLRSEINSYLEKNQIKGRIVFESDVMESLTRSIVDKIGIAFLPRIYLPRELENKSLSYLGPQKGLWKHQVCLTSHSKNKDDHLIRSFSLSFKEVCSPITTRTST